MSILAQLTEKVLRGKAMVAADLSSNNVQCPRGSDCGIEHLKDKYTSNSWLKSQASSMLVTYEYISSPVYMEEEHRIHDAARELLKQRHSGYRIERLCAWASLRIPNSSEWRAGDQEDNDSGEHRKSA